MKKNNNFTVLTLVLAFGLALGGCENPTQKPSLPAAPKGLASETKTENTIAIVWNKVSGAVKYHIYVGTSVDGLTLRGNSTVTSYLLDGLNPDTTYYIAVSTETNFGEGKKSAAITVTTDQVVKPKIPTGVASITHTETTITIAWNTVNGATGYHVYAGTSAENLTLRGSPTATSYLIEGLTANTTYYIAVSAENDAGEGEKSTAITVTTNQVVKPDVPTGLNSVTNTELTIAIAWNPVNGAEKYNVYCGTTAGELTLKGTSVSPSYLIEGLTPNITYYISVSAENNAGEGVKSASITVTTNHSIKPAAPSGLAAGDITETSIAVSWNSVAGASSYNVFAGTASDTMTLHGNTTDTSYLIEGLDSNTRYYISVSAKTSSNESDQCTSINTVTKPDAPKGLSAGTITSNSITATWTSISGVSGYRVYLGLSEDNMTQRGTPITASYTFTGLTANTVYYIAVSAMNVSGESSQSTPVTVTTKLSAPGGVIATPQSSSSSIQVSWNAVIGASSYKIYRSSSATGIYTSIGTTPGTTTYNDIGLSISTDYYYKVSALTAGNVEGDLSNYVSGRILAQTKAITSFRFGDFSVNGTINGTNISITVPNIVNLTTLAPTIYHNGKSVSPASGVAQDFTSPVQYTVTAEDNTTQSYTVTVTVTDTGLAAAFTWINYYYSSGRTYTIVAQASESLAPVTINANSNNNIILSGGTTEKTISLSGNGSLFTVSYGTLTLENNITLQGRSTNNASLVKVGYYYGALVMKPGSKIQNNTVIINDGDAFGGAVFINSGTFTMDGGTISGNRVEATSSSSSYNNTSIRAAGGGVYFYNGTFIMNNGTISNNTAYSTKFPTAGGGVFFGGDYYITFTMNGGTISDNTAQSSSVLATSYTYGGGVAAWVGGTFRMKGGTISGNSVSSADNRLGGGVYFRSDKFAESEFTKTGGTIYGSDASPATLRNTAKDTNSGHAVYASVNSTILRRNTTAGAFVDLDSSRTGSAGGWE
ncbi:MAG: fibronectin type III domain-containing protein [Treponema sp.]|jgi:hypothetical protein|nr:fibronectin type III domain-containing protein [Treponema sp.]